eukprot:TRINITY_DN30432_c1_g1_i1.p1 TRINITY_DN30432_c1_g1~~TRINITY_DN30432_c1_g1_i1.p1  ORF type:complete len:232 (+),score=39.69 TRINITY_DN30432_c1_g1_i1:157-852(+)
MLAALNIGAAAPTSELVVPADKEGLFLPQLIRNKIGPCRLTLAIVDKDGKTVLEAGVAPPALKADVDPKDASGGVRPEELSSNPVVNIRKIDGTTLVRATLRKGVTRGAHGGSSEVDLSLPDGTWIGRLCEDAQSMGTAYDLKIGTFATSLYMHFECVFETGEPTVAVFDASEQPLAQTMEESLPRLPIHVSDNGYLKIKQLRVRPNADAAVILACVVAMNLRWAEFFVDF